MRHKIPWVRILLFLLILAAGAFGIYYLLTALSLSADLAAGSSLCGVTIALLFCLKRIIICLVRLYQRFAPASIRNKCRFEPSCSQYMILAIEKYGLWKGMKKGIDRLKRCNANGGGFDEP